METAEGDSYLVSMPTKFRRNVWIKRGDFVLAREIPEGDKVRAEITRVLNQDSVKFLRARGVWPPEFDKAQEPNDEDFVNSNRPPPLVESSSSDSES